MLCDECGTMTKTRDGWCFLCSLRSDGPYVRLCSVCGMPDFPAERATCQCATDSRGVPAYHPTEGQPARIGGTEA